MLTFLFLGYLSLLKGQQIVFCDWIKPSGTPVDPYRTREMEKSGQHLYFHYSQDAIIRDPRIYFFVDVQSSGKWQPLDVKRALVDPGESYTYHLYLFKNPGTYRVTALSENLDTLTHADLELILPDYELGAEYYNDAALTLCESVEQGKPNNLLDSLPFTATEDNPQPQARVFLDLGKELLTDQLILDVWKIDSPGDETYLGETDYEVDSRWTYTQFPWVPPSPGKFRIMIFSGGEVFIASKTFTVYTQD